MAVDYVGCRRSHGLDGTVLFLDGSFMARIKRRNVETSALRMAVGSLVPDS